MGIMTIRAVRLRIVMSFDVRDRALVVAVKAETTGF
jgi:hypothetical protein